MRKLRWYEYIILTVAIYVIFHPRFVRAHDEFHDWVAPDGETGCCNKRDCRVVRSYTDPEGRLMVDYPGVGPLYVPNNVHINRLHSSGKPVACYDVESKRWYCFSPGAAM